MAFVFGVASTMAGPAAHRCSGRCPCGKCLSHAVALASCPARYMPSVVNISATKFRRHVRRVDEVAWGGVWCLSKTVDGKCETQKIALGVHNIAVWIRERPS